MVTETELNECHHLIIEGWDQFIEADSHIFNGLREWPLPIMTLLNRVTRKLARPTRRQHRAAKWAILKRITTLMQQGRLRRFRRTLVCLPGYELPSQVPANVLNVLSKRRESTRARQRKKNHASTLFAPGSAPTVDLQPLKKPNAFQPPVFLPIRPSPSPGEISQAALALAHLPRKAKKWSGWLNAKVRVYRNQRVALRSGEQDSALNTAYVFGVLGGRLVFTREPNGPAGDPDVVGKSWGVIRCGNVLIPKSPAAIVLGGLKRGRKEKFSTIKQFTCRENGSKPCSPGKRRGRPRQK
jgi:hypothetical protein